MRGTTEKLTRLRKTIAARMVESLQVSAQLTATVEVDVTAISHLRAQAKDDFKKREGASLSYLPFITMAAVEALKQFPIVNADDRHRGRDRHLRRRREHRHRGRHRARPARPGDQERGRPRTSAASPRRSATSPPAPAASKVAPDELSGGTFTITNYGSAGTLFDTPIINQPQVGASSAPARS